MQKFMQKMFPSKNGKERLRQLEKLDKLMDKSKKIYVTLKRTNKKYTKSTKKTALRKTLRKCKKINKKT